MGHQCQAATKTEDEETQVQEIDAADKKLETEIGSKLDVSQLSVLSGCV